MEELFEDETLADFISCDGKKLYLYHFTLGLWIRNYLLEPESELYKEFVENGCTDKDDMSAIIIEAFYKYEKNKPVS